MPNLKRSGPNKIILIGASTGGPGHIKKILGSLKPGFTATIVIAQHMGNDYMPSFVKQLNSVCRNEVHLVVSGDILFPAHVYVCSLLTSIKMDVKRLTFLQKNNSAGGYNPDIDYLFTSAAKIVAKVPILGIILTGIGSDGARGCQLLSEMGGDCIAENQTSAIVDGMPMQTRKRVKDINILSLDEIITKINLYGCD